MDSNWMSNIVACDYADKTKIHVSSSRQERSTALCHNISRVVNNCNLFPHCPTIIDFQNKFLLFENSNSSITCVYEFFFYFPLK